MCVLDSPGWRECVKIALQHLSDLLFCTDKAKVVNFPSHVQTQSKSESILFMLLHLLNGCVLTHCIFLAKCLKNILLVLLVSGLQSNTLRCADASRCS